VWIVSLRINDSDCAILANTFDQQDMLEAAIPGPDPDAAPTELQVRRGIRNRRYAGVRGKRYAIDEEISASHGPCCF
jgi:hypothetical protein